MKTLLLIDANSLIHRAFHALPPLAAPDGRPTGALYGLAATLLKILERRKPDYVAAAFDRQEPTFRKERFEAYKAHRPKTPDELASQLLEARALFRAFGIPTFEAPRYEADDIIATFAVRFAEKGKLRAVILTGDLDTLQLVEDPKIEVEAMKKGVSETQIYDERAVEERYGIAPSQVVDYKGLVGDQSDNIPGVRGVGPKTASDLIRRFGTVERIVRDLPETDPAYKKIIPHKDEALMSKELATVATDAPVDAALDDLSYRQGDRAALADYFRRLGFRSLVKRLGGAEEEEREKEPDAENTGAAARTDGLPPHAIVEYPPAKRALESEALKVADDWKALLERIGDPWAAKDPLFDLGIAGWLMDPDRKDISFPALAERFLKGRPAENGIAARETLFAALHPALERNGLMRVFREIEMPLVPVLAEMELTGIRVDAKRLETLKRALEGEAARLAKEIYGIAGEEFNINSPQQVGDVIFGKLGAGGTKRKKTTKTGRRSTAERVLLDLKADHPIAGLILEYRETMKIASTYVEPLLALAREGKGTIRTHYSQTGTGTGRFSSERPNLQNVPQESKWSKTLRSAFTARKGRSFVSFDYSQLELRLLAHISGDEKLKQVFREGKDVHALTASQVFNIPESSVTPALRRIGKTLNFGVVYGMGPRAFSQTSNISEDEARRFINEYFADFPKVKEWRERVKREAQTNGFVTNQNGRKRWFLKAENPKMLSEVERAAINMPVQSLEANVLKLAMVKARAAIAANPRFSAGARMLLTIHDELLFEIADAILNEITPVLKDAMERCMPLSVPLTVETKRGGDWGSMEPLAL